MEQAHGGRRRRCRELFHGCCLSPPQSRDINEISKWVLAEMGMCCWRITAALPLQDSSSSSSSSSFAIPFYSPIHKKYARLIPFVPDFPFSLCLIFIYLWCFFPLSSDTGDLFPWSFDSSAGLQCSPCEPLMPSSLGLYPAVKFIHTSQAPRCFSYLSACCFAGHQGMFFILLIIHHNMLLLLHSISHLLYVGFPFALVLVIKQVWKESLSLLES